MVKRKCALLIACDLRCEFEDKCIQNKDTCNGMTNCEDGSDEKNCGK